MKFDRVWNARRAGASIVALLVLAGSAAAQAPSLRHSAPFLGQTLELRVSGVAPGATVALYRSDMPGSVATPFGHLELDRSTMSRVAIGHADASGIWSTTFVVPLDPALAEEPQHYQALVRTPATGGAILSEAAHLRFLGARAYVSALGESGAPPAEVHGGLSVASITNEELVASIDYGFVGAAPDLTAQPVFDASSSRGAIMASGRELVIFDPFFGGVLARRTLPAVSRRLVVDAAQNTVFALEPGDSAAGQPAFVHAIDIRTGALSSSVSLPPLNYTGQWIANLERTFAYAVGFDELNARFAVARFDLAAAVPLGVLPVGLTSFERVLDMTAGPRSVYLHANRMITLCDAEAALTEIDETAGGPLVTITPWGSDTRAIVAAPDVGIFAFVSALWCLPGASIGLARLNQPVGPARPVSGSQADSIVEVQPLARGLWTSTRTNDLWSGEQLWFVDYASQAWRDWELGAYPRDIVAIDALDDPLGERACAAVREFQAGPIWVEPRLYVVDPIAQTVGSVRVGPSPESLLAVPIP